MKLYLLRHADAGEASAEGYTTDAARTLSPKGIKRTRQLANALRQMEITFDVILSSPLIRAQQTAEIVARSLGKEKQLRHVSQLAPDGALTDAIALIESVRPKVGSILLVGHEPNLSRLISLLCTGGTNLGITLKKGGFCRLELKEAKPGSASLEWLLAPRHFGAKAERANRLRRDAAGREGAGTMVEFTFYHPSRVVYRSRHIQYEDRAPW